MVGPSPDRLRFAARQPAPTRSLCAATRRLGVVHGAVRQLSGLWVPAVTVASARPGWTHPDVAIPIRSDSGPTRI